MSTAQGAYGSGDSREFGANEWANASWRRGACGGSARWSGFEIAAMVLGFIVFWPIGLAVLGYKIYQKKMGGPDLRTAATNVYNEARNAMGGVPGAQGWARGFTPATGNRAFDEWKSAELARLEAERRKLEDAHREFSEFVEHIRRAKDREEFERFMNERRAGSSPPA